MDEQKDRVINGMSKAEFDQACVNVMVDSVTNGMQELVKRVMKREYIGNTFDWGGNGEHVILDGRFSPEELEAMAWCMRNDKWPQR